MKRCTSNGYSVFYFKRSKKGANLIERDSEGDPAGLFELLERQNRILNEILEQQGGNAIAIA